MSWLIFKLAILLVLVCGVLLLVSLMSLQRHYNAIKKDRRRKDPDSLIIGIFHPYCNAGGGGERVLWCAVRAIQRKYSNALVVVYTGDTEATGVEILRKAEKSFGVAPLRPVDFVFLEKRYWVEAARYPIFTLLGQSLGSVVLGWEALGKCVPDVYIDTMGYAFTFPLFKLLSGCRVATYVHYPTISTDMLVKIQSRQSAYNNNSNVAKSKIRSEAKALYYRAFAYAYGVVGRMADVVMVNSTWTSNNIVRIWNTDKSVTSIVYPPCDTSKFAKLPLAEKREMNKIISLAQFRPEKDHELQLRILHAYLRDNPVACTDGTCLYMVGGCRNADDENRVRRLKDLAEALDIAKYVHFKTNVTYSELKHHLATAQVGLHTMWNEHFGIGVVEYLASGVIAIAHDSGGPKSDIVLTNFEGKGPCGFRASTVEEYAEQLKRVLLDLNGDQRATIQRVGRESVLQRFSEETFDKEFLVRFEEVLAPV
eukprot:CFRG1507T1